MSHLENGDISRDICDDWSGIYDAHLSGEFGYISPQLAAQALAAAAPARDIAVIDYTTGGFDEAFRGLENDGTWRILRLEEINYMTELDRPGWLLVAEKRA